MSAAPTSSSGELQAGLDPADVEGTKERLAVVASDLACAYDSGGFDTCESAAVEVIKRTAEKFDAESVAISFNGGKDAVVTVELLLQELGIEWLRRCFVFVLVHEDEFEELIEFRQRYLQERLPGVKLHAIDARDGMKEGLWRAWRQRVFLGVFMGTRKDDPSGRYQPVSWNLTTQGWPPMVRVCPILSWSFGEVWEFIRQRSVPVCSLYEQGYTSLGKRQETQRNSELRQEDGSYSPAWHLLSVQGERIGRSGEFDPIQQVNESHSAPD